MFSLKLLLILTCSQLNIRIISCAAFEDTNSSDISGGIKGELIKEKNPQEIFTIQEISVDSGDRANSDQEFRRVKRRVDFYNVTESKPFFGNPIQKSADFVCNSDESCSISYTVSHTETVKWGILASIDMKADEFFNMLKEAFTFERSVATATSTQYSVTLGQHSEGHLMFRPRFSNITGFSDYEGFCEDTGGRIAAGIFSLGLSEAGVALLCPGETELRNFSILAPVQTDGKDILDGEWYIEYKNNPWPIDTENFFNIRNKDLPGLANALVVEKTVANPMHCGRYAKDYGFKIAVYYDRYCYIKSSSNLGTTYTSNFTRLGAYSLGEGGHLNYTDKQNVIEEWREKKLCDIFDSDGYWTYCKKLDHINGAVIMFLKDK